MTAHIYCFKVIAPYKASVGGILNTFPTLEECTAWLIETGHENHPDYYLNPKTGACYTFKPTKY